MAGQLRLLANPNPESVTSCSQVILNMGGTAGTFEVQANGHSIASGDFLNRALAGDLTGVVGGIERALGWQQPTSLPPSSPATLAMRLIAEMLTTTCLDLQASGIETAWFDWAGGCRIQSWAESFGLDVPGINKKLTSGNANWQAEFLRVSGYLRLGTIVDDSMSRKGWVFDIDQGTVSWMDGGQLGPPIVIQDGYVKSRRRLEPLAAKLLIKQRQG